MPAGKDFSISQEDSLLGLLTAAGEVVYRWDAVNDRIVWSGNAGAVLGLSDENLPATKAQFDGRIGPDDLPGRGLAATDGDADGTAYRCFLKFRGHDGGFRWFEEHGLMQRAEDGRVTGIIGRLRLLNDHESRQHRGETFAGCDELTGYPGRGAVLAALDDVVADGDGVGLLLINIDGLGLLNSAYGFDLGDEVIVEIGRRVGACHEGDGFLGRVGGNQFAMIIFDCNHGRLEAAAERILSIMRGEEVWTASGPVAVTLTLGGVLINADARSGRGVLGMAEEALSTAKASGRDRFQIYRPSPELAISRRESLAVGREVLTALRDGRFALALQPIVDSASGSVEFYECLARMVDRRGAAVPAGVFLPAVEQLGIVRKLDRRAVELALALLSEHPEICLSVNVSGLTVTDATMLLQILAMVEERYELADRLIFEITETIAMLDFEQTEIFVSRLRALGCRFAIDDFGAGYTSFRHLKRLKVDFVKIDGQFVRDLHREASNRLFVDALIRLAGGMGVQVVAECVEVDEEADVLRDLGVGYLQGYLYGKPMPERSILSEGRLAVSG